MCLRLIDTNTESDTNTDFCRCTVVAVDLVSFDNDGLWTEDRRDQIIL